jgi:hypothetical protein
MVAESTAPGATAGTLKGPILFAAGFNKPAIIKSQWNNKRNLRDLKESNATMKFITHTLACRTRALNEKKLSLFQKKAKLDTKTIITLD